MSEAAKAITNPARENSSARIQVVDESEIARPRSFDLRNPGEAWAHRRLQGKALRDSTLARVIQTGNQPRTAPARLSSSRPAMQGGKRN
jgi:hypothetical protein